MSSPSEAPSPILPLQFIKGVGPHRAEALAKEGIKTPHDVLFRVPRGYIDRSVAPTIAALFDEVRNPSLWEGAEADVENVSGEISIVATVRSMTQKTVGRNRKMLTVILGDESATTMKAVFWNSIAYFSKALKEGETYVVSGHPEHDVRFNQLSITHPEIEPINTDDVEKYHQGAILPKYPMTQAMRSAGITMNLLRAILDQTIEEALTDEPEFLPDSLRQKHQLMNRERALRELHRPTSLEAVADARRRMKYEELLQFQLFLATRNKSRKAPEKGLSMTPRSPSARALLESLSFSLTGAQKRVINEIVRDLSSGAPMNRLLQGDVGSGKTVVALLCMLNAVDNGFQTVLMAPTEILAEQHARSIQSMLGELDVKVETLVGGQKKAVRNEVLSRIASGEAQIIVGTHALFEAQVEYRKLGLIVIDEQHRFGVAQRSELRKLGRQSHDEDQRTPHILVMSATPIPRTLSMTLYGDLDVSVIDELPKGRTPIETRVVFDSQLDGVFAFVREQLDAGRQAYVVYPLVEKSEKLELKSAIEHHEKLQTEVFDAYRVGLLHGQMPWLEKEGAMKAFNAREYDVLVATTVVEVGVDVRNATVMIIENAERFGLSQLHQLRGRVGRGSDKSYCFLVAPNTIRHQMKKRDDVAEQAKAATRLRTMAETTDGFKIAEVDLRLRGPGDLMGTRQSGVPEFSFADLVLDGLIIAAARADAFALIEHDPHLRKPEHEPLRNRLITAFESGTYTTVA